MRDDREEMEPPHGGFAEAARKSHRRRDNPPKGGEVRCEVCGKVWPTNRSLVMHMRNAHPDKLRGDGGRPKTHKGLDASYVTGKLARLTRQLKRSDYPESASILADGIEDTAEVLSEISAHSETATTVIRIALTVLGSLTAILTLAAFAASLLEERRAKMEARQSQVIEVEAA